MECLPQSEQSHRKGGGLALASLAIAEQYGQKIRGASSVCFTSPSIRKVVIGAAIPLRLSHMTVGIFTEKKSTMISSEPQNHYANHVTLLSDRVRYFARGADDKGTMFPETILMPFAGSVNPQGNARQQSTAKNPGEEIGTHITGYELRKRTGSGRLR